MGESRPPNSTSQLLDEALRLLCRASDLMHRTDEAASEWRDRVCALEARVQEQHGDGLALAYSRNVVELQRAVASVMACDVDWDAKYDTIFSLYQRSGVSVMWTDPDTSYEDDVRAFVAALNEMAVPHAAALEAR
jgi:hypothetical protein